MSFGHPLDYDAGLAFNYNVWTPGTSVSLFQVPWDSVYRDTVLFESKAARDAHFSGRSYRHDVERVTYLKRDAPVKLGIPYAQACQYNYMVVENPAQPVQGDSPTKFFYFVRDVRHVAPDTTEFVLQLDVWQTYMYDVTVNRGFIVRGHYGMVQASNDARPNTGIWVMEPEDMDTGAHYISRAAVPYTTDVKLDPSALLAITTTVSLRADPGTASEPKNPPARSTQMWGTTTPTETYFIAAGGIQNFMQEMANWPWIAQGIVAITAVPPLATNARKLVDKIQVSIPGGTREYPPGNLYVPDSAGGAIQPKDLYPVPNWAGVRADIEAAYRAEVGDSPFLWMDKFYTFPYCYLSITDGVGNELVLHPQYVRANDLELQSFTSLVPGNEAIRVVVKNYLSHQTSHDYSLTMRNLPKLPTVNDNAAIALASQARSTQAAREGAAWAQQRSLRSNEVGYATTTLGLAGADASAHINQMADASQTELGNRAAMEQAAFGIVTGAAGGAAGGAMAGGAGAAFAGASGAVQGMAGVMQTAMQNNINNEALSLRTSTSNAQRANAYETGAGIRDYNRGLADWAAKGDYANQISALNAKIQDTQMTPASLSGQYGGEVATWAMNSGVYRITGRVKTITEEAFKRIGTIWARYGYMVNRFDNISNNLLLMDLFTYWQVVDVHISGVPGMSEDHLNALRGIFERGVTIHRTSSSIRYFNLPANRITS